MMIDESKRAEHINAVTKKLDTVRVVDYSVVNLVIAPDKKHATALIGFSYYQLNQNDLLSAQEIQQWEFGKEGWLLKPADMKPASNPAPAKKSQ